MLFEQNDMKHLPINLENYEEYFLLYVDNELTEAEKAAVELFVEQHPELKEEWTMLMDTKLEPEDIRMDMKNDLYRSAETINESNFETFQLSLLDDELNDKEKQAILEYNSQHQKAASNFEWLSKTKLPVEEIAFPDKSVLYRSEKPAVVISVKWYRMAVAAAILVAAGLWFINKPDEVEIPIDQVTVAEQLPKEVTKSPNANNSAKEEGKENTALDNNTTTNNSEPLQSATTRPAVKISKENTSVSKDEYVRSASKEKTTLTNVESVNRNRVEEVVPMVTDPMVSTDQLNAQPAVALDVKSDYATEALTMENNARSAEQPELMDEGKQRKGMFRGIVRKANRFYNKVTNPDPERAVVKVANFEIGLPR